MQLDKIHIYRLLSCMLTLLASQASFAFCFDEAAAKYSSPPHFTIDPLMLKAIAKTETGLVSGKMGPINANGTYDIGLMQINSSHLTVLSRYGINQERLLTDACLNVQVGAWIFAKNIARYGQTWRAVGAYNAGDETKRAIYVIKVVKNYQMLSGQQVAFN